MTASINEMHSNERELTENRTSVEKRCHTLSFRLKISFEKYCNGPALTLQSYTIESQSMKEQQIMLIKHLLSFYCVL